MKSLQLHEGLNYSMKTKSKLSEETKNKLLKNEDEISKVIKKNTVSLALRRKEHEVILYDNYCMQKQSEK